MTPQPIVPELVARLNANLREAFEERAGIMEFDAGMTREHAECLALLDVLSRHPLALTGLTLLRLPRSADTQYVLTTDVARDVPRLSALGPTVQGTADLAVVLAAFGGMAVISRAEQLRKRG